jgi:phosphate/sulfate permease
VSAWVITLLLCGILVGLVYLAIKGLGRRAKVIAGVVVAGTVAFEVAAVIVYRHSSDGQTAILWIAIPVYGLLALVALRLVDQLWRHIRERSIRA